MQTIVLRGWVFRNFIHKLKKLKVKGLTGTREFYRIRARANKKRISFLSPEDPPCAPISLLSDLMWNFRWLDGWFLRLGIATGKASRRCSRGSRRLMLWLGDFHVGL